MNSTERKIGYYSIKLREKYKIDTNIFTIGIFESLIRYIQELSGEEKIYRDEKTNKCYSIESFSIYEKQGEKFYKILFKNCRYRYSPDYMSSIDGAERKSSKELYEGEKEITHILGTQKGNCFNICKDERRSGMGVGVFIKYLNQYLYKFNKDLKGNVFEYECELAKDLDSRLADFARFTKIIITTKEVSINSELEELMQKNNDLIKDEKTVEFKVQYGKSINKESIKKLLKKAFNSKTEIERIVVEGKDYNKIKDIIDTLNLRKLKTVENIPVDEKGVIDTYVLFSKMEEVFGVDE